MTLTTSPTSDSPGDRPERRPAVPRHRWAPQQHGAWAMLLLPLLLGVAASRPDPWQVVLGAAALSGYLASAVGQAWFRARRPPALRAPFAIYGSTFAVLGLALATAFPALLLAILVIGPAAVVVLGGARPGTRRDLANSLAQVAQALVLVPAAAYVSGTFEAERVVTATAIAAGYLVGTVLVVRSVLRERGNAIFAGLSVGFHAALIVLAVVWLPPAYALLAAALTVRAAGLPWLQRRLAGGARPLRPIHVGLVEIAASVAVVAVAFLVPP
ncbi:MAG: YwiC-like family protein [Chloroflexota bacterium]